MIKAHGDQNRTLEKTRQWLSTIIVVAFVNKRGPMLPGYSQLTAVEALSDSERLQ